MTITLLQLVSLLAISALCVGLLTPLFRNIALRIGVVDSPNETHKTHLQPVPYLGGLAIVLGVVLVSLGATLLTSNRAYNFSVLTTFLIPAIFMCAVGLFDDISKLSPLPRFIIQNLVGILSTMFLIYTNSLGSPTGNTYVDFVITLLWIVGLTNALNFFDNVDGGASGTAAISAFSISIISFWSGQYFLAAISIVLAGSTLGFVLWNKPPARIYMGDSGALFLGILLATITVRLEPNPINKTASFTIPFLLLALPIMDTTVAVLSRIRRHKSIFEGGKDHLSHRLIRFGLPKKTAVLTLWGLTAFFCILAGAISNLPYRFEGLFTLISVLIWLAFSTWFLKTSDV